jgi:hypothetical protein
MPVHPLLCFCNIAAAAAAAVACRTAWHDAAVGGPELRDAYCSAADKRKHHYHVLNALIAKSSGQGSHVIGSSSTFVDAVMFAFLWGESNNDGHGDGLKYDSALVLHQP